jgi:hypothetical protein
MSTNGTALREKVNFIPNQPVRLALKYAQPKIGKSPSGDDYALFTTTDNKVFFLDGSGQVEGKGMKGTDVTPKQLAHAEDFVQRAQGQKLGPLGDRLYMDHTIVSLSRQNLVRLLAWYAAIRVKSGSETPRPFRIEPREEAHMRQVDVLFTGRTGLGDAVDFGTPEQLAEMKDPQLRMEQTMASKTKDIEDAGLCQWGYQPDSLTLVLQEVGTRRASQDANHGGPEHDDTHTPADWRAFIGIYNQRAEEYESEPEIRESKLKDVAALAVAAIQSSRRKRA